MQKVSKTDSFCDLVQAEWMVYMCDTDSKLEEWSSPASETTAEGFDICSYWVYVSRMTDTAGESKYLNLAVMHCQMQSCFLAWKRSF